MVKHFYKKLGSKTASWLMGKLMSFGSCNLCCRTWIYAFILNTCHSLAVKEEGNEECKTVKIKHSMTLDLLIKNILIPSIS